MFFCIVSAIALNIHDYIDGLENVEYQYNQQSHEVEVFVKNSDISLYFQISPDIKVNIKNPSFNQTIQKNGYRIPANSTLTIKANFEQYDDFIAGFFDEKNCDFVYYSRATKTAVPLFLYFGKKMCVYHLHKSSDITIGDLKFSKIARIRANSEFLELKSQNTNINFDDQNDHILIKNHKSIKYSDYGGESEEEGGGDEEDIVVFSSENGFTYAVGYLFLALGGFFYLLIGFCFTPSRLCGCCKCACCLKVDQLRAFIDNRDNAFYTKTLLQFNEILVVEQQSDLS